MRATAFVGHTPIDANAVGTSLGTPSVHSEEWPKATTSELGKYLSAITVETDRFASHQKGLCKAIKGCGRIGPARD